ncbi:hypothetical protein AVEN_150611-1 [Araneus ventricosus]|uniref:Uncharacterized protein n=1 Tax=Araneus ventricosus TaxID=182803 RepID=A0A4Y2GNS1_ARAVE|nr:hypothetical protein AVEN_150611-1 [Araneus ventricosus]
MIVRIFAFEILTRFFRPPCLRQTGQKLADSFPDHRSIECLVLLHVISAFERQISSCVCGEEIWRMGYMLMHRPGFLTAVENYETHSKVVCLVASK